MPLKNSASNSTVRAEEYVPPFLYKYRSVPHGSDAERYVLETIQTDTVFFSSPSAFNDIFDCKPVMRAECSDDEFIEFFISRSRARHNYRPLHKIVAKAREAIGDPSKDPRIESVSIDLQEALATHLTKVGVYCISERNDDILMWSHYAENHQGICLEFDGMSDFIAPAMQVRYSKDRPTINRLREKSSIQMMEKALLTKSIQWDYEYEWRIIHQVAGCGPVSFDHNTLTGIIFGAACKQATIDVISAANASRKTPLKLSKALADNRHFKLNIIPMP